MIVKLKHCITLFVVFNCLLASILLYEVLFFKRQHTIVCELQEEYQSYITTLKKALDDLSQQALETIQPNTLSSSLAQQSEDKEEKKKVF